MPIQVVVRDHPERLAIRQRPPDLLRGDVARAPEGPAGVLGDLHLDGRHEVALSLLLDVGAYAPAELGEVSTVAGGLDPAVALRVAVSVLEDPRDEHGGVDRDVAVLDLLPDAGAGGEGATQLAEAAGLGAAPAGLATPVDDVGGTLPGVSAGPLEREDRLGEAALLGEPGPALAAEHREGRRGVLVAQAAAIGSDLRHEQNTNEEEGHPPKPENQGPRPSTIASTATSTGCRSWSTPRPESAAPGVRSRSSQTARIPTRFRAFDVALERVADHHRLGGRRVQRLERVVEDPGIRLGDPERLRDDDRVEVVPDAEEGELLRLLDDEVVRHDAEREVAVAKGVEQLRRAGEQRPGVVVAPAGSRRSAPVPRPRRPSSPKRPKKADVRAARASSRESSPASSRRWSASQDLAVDRLQILDRVAIQSVDPLPVDEAGAGARAVVEERVVEVEQYGPDHRRMLPDLGASPERRPRLFSERRGTMKATMFTALACVVLVSLGCETRKHATTTYRHTLIEGQEVAIDLGEVPAHVRYAAEHAVEGIVLSGAAMEIEDGVLEYELSGTANGVPYEIDVSPKGKVLEVEADHDEDDDDGEDDDEDEAGS